MGFGVGRYCRIFSFKENDSGKSGYINLSISKKNKDSGEYEIDFRHGCVTVCGTALKQLQGMEIPEKGVSARIIQADVNGLGWDKQKKEVKPYNFVIFALAFEGDEGYDSKSDEKKTAKKTTKTKTKSKPKEESEETIEPSDQDLPF